MLQSKNLCKKQILVVEDEEDIRHLLGVRAQAHGHIECLFDATGKDCINISKHFQPDAILLDMGLPHISGFHILRTLKADPELSKIPVIVYSAFTDPEIVQEVMALGAAQYLPKTESMSVVFEIVDSLVAETAPSYI